MKKRTILGALLLAATLTHPQATRAQQYLVLKQGSGAVAEFALADNPVITLDGGTLVVNCGDREVSVALSDVSYSFSDSPSAIWAAQADTRPEASIAFGRVAFSGLQAGAHVAVYTTDGKLTTTATADEQGRADVDISALPRGIYVLKAPGQTIKVKN